MFSFAFMQRALWVGMALGAVLPCIGLIIVLRRQSMLGDALSHGSLAGVALGLILGINPLFGAIAFCVVGALAIDYFRIKVGKYSEIATAIVMSAGIGLASILSDFAQGGQSIDSYLFGSIVAISVLDAQITVGLSLVVLLLFVWKYEELYLLSYSRRTAKLSGVSVQRVEMLFTVMTAITVSLASRTVGALIVSSFMVIAPACALQIARSYKQTVLIAVAFSELFIVGGLILSYKFDLKPGGTFVLLALLCFSVILLVKALLGRKVRK